jgi:hypothetical protein
VDRSSAVPPTGADETGGFMGPVGL